MNKSNKSIDVIFSKIENNNKRYEIDLATSKLVEKLETKYKNLGKYDAVKYISQIQKIANDLKQGVEKNGDLLSEAKKLYQAYNSMGDSENANAVKRIENDIQNDFDEIVFLYEKLRALV